MGTIDLTADRKLAIDRYLDLDLDADSAAARDLFGRVEREAALPELSLTGDGDPGSICGHLTSGMTGWLADHVSRPRQGALAAVEAIAARMKLGGGVKGIVDGIEEDRLRRDRNQRRAQETRAFYEKYHEKLSTLRADEQEYLALKAYEAGREAKIPSRMLDYGAPVLIMIPEFAMNYMSFLKLSGVPAIGFGSSAVVALAIAVAAYMAGTFTKAYAFYMNADREGRKSKGLRQIGIALFLLFVALGAVGYARYHMVLEQWEAAKVLGLPLPNIAALTAGLLAGNLLVFSIGTALTFNMHDENPDYAAKASRYERLRNEVEQIRRRQLTTKLQSIESGHKHEVDRLRKMGQLMAAQPETYLITEMMQAIEGKDEQVIGLLNNYRLQLVERVLAANPELTIKGPITDRYSARGAETITLSEFGALSLHLYRSN